MRRYPPVHVTAAHRYETVCDVGGATGQLCTVLASYHPHLRLTTFDLPVVAPIAGRAVAAAGLGDRISVASGDFFADPLPKADVITMGLILHDWNLERKRHLIRAAYDALPDARPSTACDARPTAPADAAARAMSSGSVASL